MNDSIISVRGLRKQYGSVIAVDDVSLDVRRSEVFGILGPNGAGKTTTLEMIEGLRQPDDGEIVVAGIDARRQPDEVKRRIGVQLQTTSLFDFLTVAELVALFASLYDADDSPSRVAELLGLVSLHEKSKDYANTLSGGQQQRLSIALALANDPEIVFLDEPTTGLDPQARRNLWDLVEMIRSRGNTIVLTTHSMEEAELLCDRVAVMDNGRIILCDTPDALIASLDATSSIIARFGSKAPDIKEINALPGAQDCRIEGSQLTVQTSDLPRTMGALMELSASSGLHVDQLSTTRPTLEDVFLHHTGRALRA